MNEVLQVYDVELLADGPIYIGSGKEIGKKQYAFDKRKQRIYVLKDYKLAELLIRKNLMSEYEKFMLSNSRDDIGKWLEAKKVDKEEYLKCTKYELDSGDTLYDERSKLSIMECIKDSYGKPYIPGSSVKGMLRTILLSQDIVNYPEKYIDSKKSIVENVEASNNGRKTNRNLFLKKEISAIENAAYRTMQRPETRPEDAVNDCMSGFIVSDSQPLSTEDLILCQRKELHTDGQEKTLNVLREAIRPGTKIKLQITIDTSKCQYTKKDIENAIANFKELYYNNFLSKYSIKNTFSDDCVWLGGGVGFANKTEIYSLFDHKKAVETIVNIFEKTNVPRIHKHNQDIRKGVSPHICKVTYYNGKRYQMGLCHLKITPI